MNFAGLLFLGLVINTLLSLVVASAAREKGLSYGGFFWLSFLTSFVVGLLVAIVIPVAGKFSGESSPILESATGNVARTNSGEFAKCPFCAEWVKAEAKVCRYCGRDIERQIKELLELARAEALIQSKARDAQQLRVNQENRAKYLLDTARRKAFIRKPSTIVAASSLGLLIILGVAAAITVPLVIDARGKALDEQALAKKLEGHTDWVTNFANCESSNLVGISYEISDDNKRADISGIESTPVAWLNCIGREIAVDAPLNVTNQGTDEIPMGTRVESSYLFFFDGQPVYVGYGNLRILTSPSKEGTPYNIVITRE